MSTYRFDALLRPRSLALVGASSRIGSVGNAVLANLRESGFEGAIHLVNPRHGEIDGQSCHRDLMALEQTPDLVIICSPAESVPAIVDMAAERGVQACIILTAGLGRGDGSLAAVVQARARAAGMRVVGPNCLGLMSPPARLNASFAACGVEAGDLALISQSGAVAAGLIDWAASHRLGFAGVVTLGDQLDVDFGDCLDHFALDSATRAILLYVEAISDARKFMSAVRAAARVKPVVVIKAGRHAQAAVAAATHTGALAGSDAVYDAVFRRAGLVRVHDIAEMFAAAETLGRQRPFDGNRIAVLTNGGGIGVLAVDRLIDRGGTLAELAPETMARLDAVLPANWSRANPVDIIGDADARRFVQALEALLDGDDSDAILVLDVATRLADPGEAAKAIVETVERRRREQGRLKPIFAAWVGAETASGPRLFSAAGIPAFTTEADAVRGVMHLISYRQAQRDLTRMPDSLPPGFSPDTAKARALIAAAIAQGRRWLDPIETFELLAAYEIPAVAPKLARTPAEAAALGEAILAAGQPVALKLYSPDIIHKSDIGGVALDLTNGGAIRSAAESMIARARQIRPAAKLAGFLVQPMIRRPHGRELIAGIADDPTFGPVIVFGRGGTAVEAIADKALALPPLDLDSARELIARTRVARVLKAYRNVPAADQEAVALTLVRLAQLAADLPEVRELDLNPLLADPQGALAVDARISIAAAEAVRGGGDHPRMVIRPYPRQWERRVSLQDGRSVQIRPLRPEDEALYPDFLGQVTAEDLRLRFFSLPRKPNHDFIARLTQLDYARAIAFAALDAESGKLLGVSRLHADANHERGEYAVLVRSDLKGLGLGWTLMELLIAWAREEGLALIHGQVLRANATMLRMCAQLGFAIAADKNDIEIMNVTLPLRQAPEAATL